MSKLDIISDRIKIIGKFLIVDKKLYRPRFIDNISEECKSCSLYRSCETLNLRVSYRDVTNDVMSFQSVCIVYKYMNEIPLSNNMIFESADYSEFSIYLSRYYIRYELNTNVVIPGYYDLSEKFEYLGYNRLLLNDEPYKLEKSTTGGCSNCCFYNDVVTLGTKGSFSGSIISSCTHLVYNKPQDRYIPELTVPCQISIPSLNSIYNSYILKKL